MEQLVTSSFRLGIIAGGQLGKMLSLAASNWDVKSYILDPSDHAPAAPVSTKFMQGDYLDFDTVYQFGKMVDMVTLEIENVNTDALIKLKEEGIKVLPNPEKVMLIKDKGLQKKQFTKAGIPTSEYVLCESPEEIRAKVEKGDIRIPFVQKLRHTGFDGRGVKVINHKNDMENLLEGPSLIEKKEDILKEISIIVAQSTRAEIKTFPAVEMIFNPDANLVEYLLCPADIEPSYMEKASELAIETARVFGLHGVAAVEMFITENGDLLVNEVAPRPHNSGHHTIEGNFTSQYEQHLRGIFGFPLGSVDIKIPSIMVNLLGEPGFQGHVQYQGLTECMGVEGIKLHIYGKKETRPFRKMGHATVLDHDLTRAWEKAKYIKEHLKVRSWENLK